MEVTRIRALRGPNLWSHNTAIQSVVSCTQEECAIDRMAGFEVRLRARFPQIAPFQPIGHSDSISLAHVLELAALGLQAQAGCPVTFSCTTPRSTLASTKWSWNTAKKRWDASHSTWR